MGQSRASSRLDWVRQLVYRTGILWLTPFVGRVDRSDLEYLRESILRDLEWIETLLFDAANQTPALLQVQCDLAALVDRPQRPGATARLLPIVYPWHVASGWTDYAATRVALLAALPKIARPAALAELACMEAIVLPGSRAAWHVRVAALEAKLTSAPDDPSIPSTLQALWREIDFGRNYHWLRVAKNTTIMSLTWFLVLGGTITAAIFLQQIEGSSEVNPWFVALLGLLGGSISALRSTNLINLGERQPIDVEAIKLRLRPVVGAAMAVVVYVLGQSHIAFELLAESAAGAANATPVSLSSAPIHIQVHSLAWGYYALAFLAGFAERWFLQIVDLAQSRFDPPHPPAPPAGPPSTGDPPGGTPSGGTPSGGTPSGGTPSGGTPSGGTPSGGTAAGGNTSSASQPSPSESSSVADPPVANPVPPNDAPH